MCDSTAAVAITNKMGTFRSTIADTIAKSIWNFCQEINLWITASHIPGVDNIEADKCTRKLYKDSEWKLNPELFLKYCKIFNFIPSIDCFASRINKQIEEYISFKPDPYASHIDAFTISWNNLKGYMFPPFSVIPKVLQKIQTDNATVMVVVPHWPTQSWFTTFVELSIKEPFLITPLPKNLVLPQDQLQIHPLAKNLTLMVGILSGISI